MIKQLTSVLCSLVIYGSVRCDSELATEAVRKNAGSFENGSQEIELFEQLAEIKQLISDIILKQNLMEGTLQDKFSKQEQIFEQRFKKSEEQLSETITAVVLPKINQLSEQILQVATENKQHLEKTTEESGKHGKQTKQLTAKVTGLEETMKYYFNVLYYHLKPSNAKMKTLPVRSCADEFTKKSGPYWLQPSFEEEPFEGYCEQQRLDGGWLVIQRRTDGRTDFYRSWADYKAGFGDRNSDFWLGLETVHRLTRARKHILAVEVENLNGKYGYAMYNNFVVGNETEQYKLKQVGKYSGTAGDSLTWHKGMKFTTKDRDNDIHLTKNCAALFQGAWWYGKGALSNLNGPFAKDGCMSNLWFYLNEQCEGLKMSRMMVKVSEKP